jgi:Cu/Ag efflux protein CusF
MRKPMLMMAALVGGALTLGGVQADEAKQASDDAKATGMVTEVDKVTNEITIGEDTYILADSGGGAAMMPQVGAEVTVFYREEGDKKMITRIGQAQQ